MREVHNWSSRPFWPQGIERPKDVDPVPAGLDWDLWLGPAPERPFNKAYLPFVWRGWYDFGDGSFGDMGCYSFAGVFKILDLTPPVSVESSTSESYAETFPKASIVYLNFPAIDSRPALRMSWYDGGLRPPRPAGLRHRRPAAVSKAARTAKASCMSAIKAFLLAGFNGNHPRVYPESPKYRTPASVRREPAHRHRDRPVDRGVQRRSRGRCQFRESEPGDRGFSPGLHCAALAGRIPRVGYGQDAHHEFGEGERVCGPSRPDRI